MDATALSGHALVSEVPLAGFPGSGGESGISVQGFIRECHGHLHPWEGQGRSGAGRKEVQM